MTGDREIDAESRIAQIYESYAADVTTYFLRRCPLNDAYDAVGETFLVVWKRLDVVPDEPGTLPWLYGVARNVLANQRRGNLRQTRLGDRLAAQATHVNVDAPQACFEAAEEVRQVRAALGHLAPEDAEILRLAAWEAMTPTEIAKVLDVSPGSARQRLYRARQRLRRQLNATNNGSKLDPTEPTGRLEAPVQATCERGAHR